MNFKKKTTTTPANSWQATEKVVECILQMKNKINCNIWLEMPDLSGKKNLEKKIRKKNPPPPLPTAGRLLKRLLNVFYK